mmetsp:Transcript_30577/g.57275  ORF Transcript_30577/g.57275 Transcript_30577/m.57275 type:complete len:228 (-) Transcript_30577:46-729(-)|eukprot:CAMPEP_0178741110 /NCGR_PEP_ID=MMETSP0744-20121128/4951_1 /TAXON_ID=913974 /ORGANISM="Nitzschia punctata, Strain CCMP561" /LENGTH=227 /DNA_ID=CAMNT_0020393933 /DNA_START=60 /DNA_END=743 /DNA_ORIENTATION=-
MKSLQLLRRYSLARLVLCPSVVAFSPNFALSSQRYKSSTAMASSSPTASSSTSSSSQTIGTPSKELLNLFNEQVTNEFTASHLYLSASIWFNARDWEGMAAYMLSESEEERGHALSFIDFGIKRNIPLQLQSLDEPPSAWHSPEDVWETLLAAEKENTQSLLKIAEEAKECNDFSLVHFLNPFHMEQVESEDKLGTILSKVKDEKKTPGLLRQLDNQLGEEASSENE